LGTILGLEKRACFIHDKGIGKKQHLYYREGKSHYREKHGDVKRGA